ncbi:Hint domain-containing protein [Sulfitobacter sp.]|uniref:Hint domain-containing protein n=1 Tax=Sulfitobacter sp. TaxID=1903071 RepID=UPI003EF868C3
MAAYTVTTSNWNDPGFWSSISEGSSGQTLDFSALPSNFTIGFDPATNALTIGDGSTTFVVRDAGGSGPSDAVLGGGTLFSFFTNLIGSAGNDSFRGTSADEYFDGGGGNDTLYGEGGNDTLVGGDGVNILEGGIGDDSLVGNASLGGHSYLKGGAGADTLDGSAGNYDIASYYDATSGVVIDLSDGVPESGGDAAGDVLIGIEQIDGSNTGDDFIRTNDDGTQIKGWGGNDTLHGGAGNDRLLGGSGDDSLYGHGGSDRFWGGTGSDRMEGGDDADTFYIENGFGADTIIGGEGAGTGTDRDVVDFSLMSTAVTVSYFSDETGQFSDGTDTASFSEVESFTLTGFADFLTAGADTFGLLADAGAGDDTIYAGQGADTLSGGDGADEIYADAGDDLITGGAGNDELGGNAGRDTLLGEAGDDYLQGMEDDDSVSGGDGSDTIIGGTGDDTLTGGDGDDLFIYAAGDGHDTITDFNFGNTGTLSDGDAGNNDFIDLSRFYDSIFELQADQADDGVLNQSNTEADYSDNDSFGSGSLTFTDANSDGSSFTAENTNVVCFTSGTAIRTPLGDRLIDDLRVGDLVSTMDNGPQPLRWIGRRRLGSAVLASKPNLRPILIPQGVLGVARPLLLSPQHGMLLARDHLLRAKHLVEIPRSKVRVAHGRKSVTYIHLMFDAHQIVFAENAASESFYPGPMAQNMLEHGALSELRMLFPDVFAPRVNKKSIGNIYGDTARQFLAKQNIPHHLPTVRKTLASCQ